MHNGALARSRRSDGLSRGPIEIRSIEERRYYISKKNRTCKIGPEGGRPTKGRRRIHVTRVWFDQFRKDLSHLRSSSLENNWTPGIQESGIQWNAPSLHTDPHDSHDHKRLEVFFTWHRDNIEGGKELTEVNPERVTWYRTTTRKKIAGTFYIT